MSLTLNHFQLFNLPETFAVDSLMLAETFRELQRTAHPDKFANRSDQERRLAMQHATQINEAFQTLKHPLKRGQYLLMLKGIEMDSQQASAMDQLFLFEQMELREKLESIAKQADPMMALEQFMDSIAQGIEKLINTLNHQFQQADYAACQNSIRKLQFFYKLQEEALNLEEQL